MSDNIPLEIQVEIITRLPVKSLIQFRSVSKSWKSLIDSSQFIARYSTQHTQPQHLLVTYNADDDSLTHKYVSIVDDNTFPDHKVSLTLPLQVKWLTYHRIIGCSHGLLCLYGGRRDGSQTHTAVLWNLSIRKAVAVNVPNVVDTETYATVLGFGVCRETNDPKIVKITYNKLWWDMGSISSIQWQVEVFTLSTGVWRRLYSNLPRKSVYFDSSQVVVDGCLYLLATYRVSMYDGFSCYELIISFDMTREEFREVKLPNSLARPSCMYKLRESLVVLQSIEEANNRVICVWKMEDGVPKSFTKLFNVHVSSPEATIRGFRKSGEPIVEPVDDIRGRLDVYEPYSKHIKSLGIGGMVFTFFVYPYVESLLLLDQPYLNVFNEVER